MKKVVYTILIIIAIFVGYGIFKERTFTSLEKEDFQLLFPNHNDKIKVSYHKDYIGWSHGDFFEMFIYEMVDVSINPDYPKIKRKWEYISLPDDAVITKWKKCPIDSVSQTDYAHELAWITKDGTSEGEMLNEELKNVANYYCSIYVSELEKYFLLYNPSKNKMYYIRQKGF